MITAILSAAVVWCLFYGKINSTVLAVICAGLGAVLVLPGRHRHNQFLTIDVLAYSSRLRKVNPSLKFWAALILMVICISAKSPAAGIFLTVIMAVLVVFIGDLELHDYVNILALPVSFLMMSGLVLLFEITAYKNGVISISIPLFGGYGYWLCVSEITQARAALVLSRALGAVSCLYLLSLTTPMADLIGVLRRSKCPNVMIELMYLIYRYIFILLSMHHTMKNAAKSRLGYIDYRTSIRTTGKLYSNLLSRSYRQANNNFDAMESRCYDTEIRFLENRGEITVIHISVAVCITVCALCLSLLFS